MSGVGVRLLPCILVASLVSSGCGASLEHDGPLFVSCDGPAPPDTTVIQVVLDEESRAAEGRILVRVDSLASREGPIFDAPSGFLVQAFATVGPGFGCVSLLPVGAVIQGPGRSLSRAWIHVKSDLPVHVSVQAADGRIISGTVAEPGTLVEPLTWAAGS